MNKQTEQRSGEFQLSVIQNILDGSYWIQVTFNACNMVITTHLDADTAQDMIEELKTGREKILDLNRKGAS